MSASTLQINGAVVVGDGACGPCDDAGSSKTVGLGLQCPNLAFGHVASTDSPFQLSSALEFVDIGLLQQFSAIEFILLQTEGSDLEVRLGAAPAEVLGSSYANPTVNQEAELAVDGAPTVTTVFDLVINNVAEAVNTINAAFSLAGQPPPASVVGGLIQITGVATGTVDGSVDIQTGNALGALGLAVGVSPGAGQDIQIGPIWLQLFARSPNAPTRIQLKGTGRVSILAAGIPA